MKNFIEIETSDGVIAINLKNVTVIKPLSYGTKVIFVGGNQHFIETRTKYSDIIKMLE